MFAPDQESLYPLFLRLAGRTVLVVGAGPVAERKIAALLASRARVRVVAPHATKTIRLLAEHGRIAWDERKFNESDVDGVWLALAATSDSEAQRRVADACEARQTFLVAVDDPPNASAYSGAVVKRPPFLIAISSSGEAPALARLLREILEQVIPGETWVEHARRLRAKWRADDSPMADRFGELVKEFKQRVER
ncbi:MAG: bifunctional precorrin-2 dehydrogenase/sirohydrochlorin ferrochelatase [Myxococcota bacterium]|nr:bifunctional precorrin-2 dehydrogenase/sirohydrochlorin ferrochelatase [Myxococcota bacterium]